MKNTYVPRPLLLLVLPALATAWAPPAPASTSVQPILECVVRNADGTYTAHFGYQSDATGAVSIAAGSNNNKFSPSPKDRGQPSVFQPGRSPAWPNSAFMVVFGGQALTWQLNGQTVTATSNSLPCAHHVTIDKEWYDGDGRIISCPPLDLPTNYLLIATSTIGTAVGLYPPGSNTLAVKYSNRRPNSGDSGGCVPVVSATFGTNQQTVTAFSSKDLSNVVLAFLDGAREKFDSLSGYAQTFSGTGTNAGKQIVGLWIKSGCNASGDGSGYGEYVDNPNLPGGASDSPGDDSLWVPVGTTYTVSETNLPPGWSGVVGLGTFPMTNNVCVACGEGSAETFCRHAVQNRYVGQPDYRSALGDLVWADLDADAVQDAGEPAIPGVGVVLTDALHHQTTNFTTTAGYFFPYLGAGLYQVCVLPNTLPAGARPTWDYDGTATAHCATLTLGAGETNRQVDFGYANLPCVTNWTGSLGTDRAICLYEAQWITITGAVSVLPAQGLAQRQAAWRVVFPQEGSLCPTGAPNCLQTQYQTEWISGAQSFTLAAWWPGIRATDTVVEIHYGANVLDCDGNPLPGFNGLGLDLYWYPWVCPPPAVAAVGDLVWEDRDADCVRDPGEDGLGGVRLRLKGSAVSNTTLTDLNGVYFFTNLPAGSYTVEVDAASVPEGYVRTCPAGAIPVTLAGGQQYLDADFGYRPQADLRLAKTAEPAADCVLVGSNVAFLVTLTNRGPAAATGVRVLDRLPDGLELAATAPSQGIFFEDGGIWLPGTLPPHHAATLAFTATADTAGTFTNRAVITACDQAEADPSDNAAEATVCATQPPLKLRPTLECVTDNGDGTYTAHFGYVNEDAGTEFPLGPNNRFDPAPMDRGQPVTFASGRTPPWPQAAFPVVFDGAPLTWTLNGRTVTATRDSAPCAYRMSLDKQWVDGDGVLLSGPPANLPADYRLIATSRLGTAIGTYPDGVSNLVVTYDNAIPPALDNDGLWVPCCGQSFTVGETNLPAGWAPAGGLGTFPAVGATTNRLAHTVTNRDRGSTNFMVDLELRKGVGWYAYRKRLVVDHTRVGCELTNFPLLVSLTAPELRHADQGGHVRHPAGYDIVFRQSTGARLDFELEHYDPAAGTLVAWVRLPYLSPAADTELCLDYGNAAVYESAATPAQVWDGDFVMVQHLEETSGAARDSTAFAHDGESDAVAPTNGQVDGAQAFGGPAHCGRIRVPATTNLSFTGDFTVEGWFNWNSGPWTIPISKGQQWVCGDYWLKLDHAKPIFDVMGIGELKMTNNVAPGWHHLAARRVKGRYNMNTLSLLVDGEIAVESNKGGTSAACAADLYLGAYLGSNNCYQGVMDEVRLSRRARSDCWLATSYRNQSAPAAFVAAGPEEARTNRLYELGDRVPFRLDLWNAGPTNATYAEVTDRLAAGLNYVGQAATTGAYAQAASRWSVSNLAVGATGTLWLTVDVTGGPWVRNAAEVTRCTETDLDSTPANGRTNEDDWAAVDLPVNATDADLEVVKSVSRYKQFKKITVLHTNFCEELTGFPLLVSLTDPDLRLVENGGFVRHAQGYDIIFRDADGAQLPHELEHYDGVTGQLTAWVRVPRLSPREDTELYLYYGNSVSEQPTTRPTEVWDDDFVMVQHFRDEGGTLFDATARRHDGSAIGGVSGGTGPVGAARGFNGTDACVVVPADAGLSFAGSFTLETWLKPRSSRWSIPISKGEQWVCGDYWLKVQDDRPNFDVMGVGDATADTPLPENEWTHVAAVFRRGSNAAGPHQFEIFVNGEPVLSRNKNGPPRTCDAPLYLGSYLGTRGFFDGWMDETRLSRVGRGACWLKAAYRNQRDPTALMLIGAQHAETNAVVDVGDLLDFVVQVFNRGPSDAYNVRVDDVLAAGFSHVSHLASQGDYEPGAGAWEVGTVSNGASATLKITVRVTRSGRIVNHAEVARSNQSDPDSTPGNGAPGEDDFGTASVQDTDNDGIADEWEEFYYGTLAEDGLGDLDGDGSIDLNEYFAGTSPTNQASYLGFVQPTWHTAPGGGVLILWNSEPYRRYHLFRSTNLLEGLSGFKLLQPNVNSTSPTNILLDETATNTGPYFYQIQVAP